MKQKLTLFLIALFTSVGAWADTDTQSYTVTYELVSSGRTYSKYYQDNTANTNLWCNRWEVRGNNALSTFPENIPGIFISSDGYCISAYNSKIYNASSASSVFTIHALGTGIVTGYTLTAVADNGHNLAEFTKTITPSAGGDAVTWTQDNNGSQTVTVTGLSENTATFTLAGTVDGELRLNPSSFQMTVELNLLNSNSDIDVNKYYYIACPRGGLSTNDGQLASTFKNDSYTMKPFAFLQSGDNYYLYSLEDNKYVSESGALADSPSAAIEINTTGKSSDKYPTYLKIGTKYLRTSNYQTTYGVNTANLTHGDAGNYYAIVEGGSLKQYYKDRIDAYHGLGGITSSGIDAASGFTAIYEAYNDALEEVEGKFFKLKNYSLTTKYLYVTGTGVTTIETAEDALVQFRFMSDGSVAIFGGKNQKYVGSTSQSAQAAAVDSPAKYVIEYDDVKGYAFHYTSGNNRAYLHCAASQSYNVVGWSTDATATWWNVTEVDAITYILKENDVEFLRSSRGTTVGATITALPADLQRVFTNYTYPVASLTTVAGENEFVANITFNMPFTASTDYATAQWYYVKMNRTKYAIYSESAPYALNTTQNLTANGMWAFIGNPYTGIKVINKAAGDGKYLQATATQPSMTTTPTSWTIGENGGNFTLHVSDYNYINDYQGQGSMKYWNDSRGATADGSTFIVEEAEPTIVINKTTGTYYTEGGAAIDPTAESGFWGPTWKSTRTIGANNLLTLTTSTGMNSKNADIYTGNDGAAMRYTLTAATGYVITGYSVTGTANSTDITISPRIRKNLTITSGQSGTLSVTDLDLKTTSFTLSGANSTKGNLSSVTLSVTLKPTATVSYTPPVANNTTATIGYKHIATGASRYMTYMKDDAEGVRSANQVSSTFDLAPSTAAGFTFEYNSELRAYYIKETSTNKYVYAKDTLTWDEGNRNTTYNVAALGVDDLPGDDEGKTIFQWTIDDGGTSVGQASYYIRPKSNTNTAISVYSQTAGILGFYDLATKNYEFAHASLITWEQQVGLYYTSARSSNVMKAGKVGYPRTESTAYTNLYGLISTFIGGHTYTKSDYTNLSSYYDAYIAATDIQKPIDGKVYSFVNVQAGGTTMFYLNDNDGTLTPTAYTEGVTVLPESAEFVCHVTGDRYVFVSKNGRYMQGASKGTNAAALATSYNSEKQDVTFYKFPAVNSGNVEQTNATFAFGRVWMETQKGANRSYTTDFIIKGADGTYDNCSGAYLRNGLSTVYQIVARDDYYNKVRLISDGSDAYASLYLPFSVTIPDGITAYAVTSQNGVTAHLESIVSNGILPANTAAILRKDGQTTNETIYLSPAEGAGSNSTTPYSGFGGTVTTTTRASLGTGTTYVLGKKSKDDSDDTVNIGLYRYIGTNLAKGKAYLFVADENPENLVKALFFDFDDNQDAITSTFGETDEVTFIYNLAGQKLNKMQKGINIVNGKKVLK